MKQSRWQFLPGVSKESWDYIQSEAVARDYDQDLSASPLFQLDEQFTLQLIQEQERGVSNGQPLYIADFGCGTGRISRAIAKPGRRILNIDLSEPMLRACQAGVSQDSVEVVEIRGNLSQCQFLAPDFLHLSLCLFSSLGMIRPRAQRLEFLKCVCKSLSPSGKFLVHAHNRWRNLLDPGGIRWLLSSFLLARRHNRDFGDRFYPSYLGLPNMYLHIYSRHELVVDLREAGFRSLQILPLDAVGKQLLSYPSFLSSLRAGGFLVIAAK